MPALRLEDIKALNIEAASVCNADCPFCSRKQKVRPYGAHRITFDDFRRLPASLVAHLRRITFGGNFGDLCCNPDLVAIARHVRAINGGILLEGDTNGSQQSESWWRELGAAFDGGAMVFALDGLEATHALHRRGTDFQKILRNMAAFIAGGGSAQWQFIVFRHNEHQLEEAAAMAEKMGCRRFYALPSRDYDDTLRPPTGRRFRLKRELYAHHRARLPEAERTAACRPLARGTLYIAADGTVHPCCYAHLMFITEHNRKFRFIVPLVERYHRRINFKTRPIAEIVAGPYFEEVFARSAKNPYCATRCNRRRTRVRRELLWVDRFFEPGSPS